jgi:N-acetylmuramoyl-L-alanine amidase
MTLKKSRRRINEIIVHCTATPEGRDYTVADIRQMHKAQGWVDIGYHYIIYRDGSIHDGRNVDMVGAHCQGHNAQSIGVCYVGGVARDGKTPKDTRTQAQKDALVHLLMELVCLYPDATIRGHRDFAAKACPSFDATREYKNL